MAPTDKQLEKIKKIEEIAQQWLNNYEKYDLKSEINMSAAYPQVKDAHDKASFISKKFSEKVVDSKEDDSADEASNVSDNNIEVNTDNPLTAWSNLEALWEKTNIASLAEGNFSLSTAKSLLNKVNNFISTASLVATVVSKISILASAANKAKEWIALAEQAIDKIELAIDLLDEHKDLLSAFTNFQTILSKGKLTEFKLTKTIDEVKSFFSNLDRFKNYLSKLPGAAKELAEANNWRTTINTLIKNAGGFIEEALADENANDLPDWYDKLNEKITNISSLLPKSLTAVIPADILTKVDAVKKEVEQFLAKATKGGEQAKTFIEGISKAMASIEKAVSSGKALTDALKNKDWKTAYDQIQVLWKEVQSMAGTLALNTKIEDVLAKIDTLKSISDSWLGTFLPEKFTDIITEINNIKNIVESLATITAEVKTFAEAVKNKDWATILQSLKKAYTAVMSGQDLVKGTNIDDAIVAKAQDILKQLEQFIKDTTGLEGNLGLQIAQAKDMVMKINSFINKGKELVDAVKNGDWQTVYNSIKDAYNNLDAATGFIPGTTVDDEAIAAAQKLKAQMEDFIKTKLGGETGDLFKCIEEIKGLYTKVSSFPDLAKEFIENVKEGNWFTVFEQIKSAYLALGKIEDLTKFTNLDNKVLAKVQSLQKSVDEFLAKVTGVNGLENQLAQVKIWKEQITSIIATGKDIINDFANRDIKSAFNKILNAWNQIQQTDGATTGGLAGKALEQVQKLQAEVDAFITHYSKGDITSVQDLINKAKEIQSGIKSALAFVNTIKGNIENKEFGKALETILIAWTNFNKTTNNLIPGTNIDEQLISESQKMQKQLEAFIQKYSNGALTGDIPQMIEQIKGYVNSIQIFINDVTFIYEAIKSGDKAQVFAALKKQWDIIEKMKGDIIPGTTLDTKIYEAVKNLEAMATKYLEDFFGATTQQEKDVINSWISIGKNIISYFLSKEPIPSLEHLMTDKVVVKIPTNIELSADDQNRILEEEAANINGSLQEKLIHILTTITRDIKAIEERLLNAKKQALDKHILTVQPIIDTKVYFDKVMKKQKVVSSILSALGTVIEATITTFLIPAGPAAIIVPIVFKLLKGFENLGSVVASIPNTGNSNLNMGIQLLGTFLSGNTAKLDSTKLSNISADLQAAYNLLVDEKYQEIQQILVKINNTIVDTNKQLNSKSVDAESVKKSVLTYSEEWKSVKLQIEQVYLDSNSLRVNSAALTKATKRILYMDWLINNKDISLVKEIVADLIEIGITAEAGVDLTNSVGAKIARGLGQMFGKLLSFGESGKIEKLKAFASGNINTAKQTEFKNILALIA